MLRVIQKDEMSVRPLLTTAQHGTPVADSEFPVGGGHQCLMSPKIRVLRPVGVGSIVMKISPFSPAKYCISL